MKQAKALFFILSCFLMVFSLHSQDFTYVGAQKCKICHGPGGTYKKLGFMKNRDVAAKNGLVLYASTDAIKTRCLTCHDAKTFDFDSSWEKIKHSIPGKE